MSLLGCSTAQRRTDPEIKIVTRIERAVPPVALTKLCKMPPYVPITTEADIVDSRESWIVSWLECSAQHKRLVEWNLEENQASPEQ